MANFLKKLMGVRKGFGGVKSAKSEKGVLLEALENRSLMSSGFYDDGYYEYPGYEDPGYEDPYGGYYGGGYGDGGYNGDPVDEAPIVTNPDMMYFEIGTPSVRIDLGHYFMDAPQMASALTFSVQTNTDPSTATGTDIVDNRWLVVTFDASKAGYADVEVAATDASGLTSSAYFRLIIDETVKTGPVVVTTPTLTMPEDSVPVRLDLNAIFDDVYTKDSDLVFGVVPYFPPLIKSAVIDGHHLVVTPAENMVGSVGVVVSATDTDGQSTTYMVLVNVTDVVPTIGGVTTAKDQYVLGAPGLKDVDFTVDGVLADAHNKVSIFLDVDGDGLLSLTKDKRLAISPDLDGAVRHATADLSFLGVGTHTILAVAWEDNNSYMGSQLSKVVSTTVEILASGEGMKQEGSINTTSEEEYSGDGGGGGGDYEPNQPPVASALEYLYFELEAPGTKIDLWQYFSDPDQDVSTLVFMISSHDPTSGVTGAEITDNRYMVLTFTDPAGGNFTDIEVTAFDEGGLSAAATYRLFFEAATNNGPVVVSTPNVAVNEDSASVTVDLNAIFEDTVTPDSGLTYSVLPISYPDLIASAKIEGGNLVVTFNENKIGGTTITVMATDGDGQSTTYALPVFVSNTTPTISEVTIEKNYYMKGAPALSDVDVTVTGLLAGGHTKVSIFVDTDKDGHLDLDTDQRLTILADAPGTTRTGSLDLSGLSTGEHTLFAVAWEDNYAPGTASDLSTVVSTSVEIYSLSAVSAKSGASQVVTYTDLNGNTVKASLTGPGSFEVFFESAGAKHNASRIVITGTDAAKSGFTLTVTPAKMATVLTTDVGTVEIDGGLSNFSAGKANLMGDLAASGLVKALTLNDVNSLEVGEQHSIALGGFSKDKTTITMGHVADISLTVGAHITSLKAVEWIDGNAENDLIAAAGLGTLTTTGEKTAKISSAGDFDADLNLTNAAVSKTVQTVSSISIAGSTHGNWELNDFKAQSVTIKGDASGAWASEIGFGSVTINGKATGLMIESGGDLTTFKAGQTSNSHISAMGTINTFTVLDFIGGGIHAGKAVSITTTGRAATLLLSAVAGNFTGDLEIHGISTKANAQSLGSLKVAGLLVGGNDDEHPDIDIHGGVGSITAGNTQGVVILVDNKGANQGLIGSFKTSQATNTQVYVAQKINSIAVNNWTNGRIHASAVGSLTVTGTRNNKGETVGGDFNAHINVSGAGLAKNVLSVGSISVTGAVIGAGGGSGPVWNIEGNVGSISIGRSAELAIVVMKKESTSAAGNIASFKSGEVVNTFLNADAKISAVTVSSWKGGSINAGSVGTLSATGNYEAHLHITGEALAKNVMALGSVNIGGAAVGSGTVEEPDWHVEGPAGSLTFGSVSRLAAFFDDAVGAVTVKATADDFSFVADGHFDDEAGKSVYGNVASLKIGKLINSYVQADKLGSFSVTGYGSGKTAVSGEMNNTYVYAVGEGVTGKALALGSATVAGAVNGSEFHLRGNTGVVTVGAFLSSSLRMGVADHVPAGSLPENASQFAQTNLSLGGFVVTGKAVADVTAATFVNSLVAAPTLMMVSLKLVSSSLPGQTGFAALNGIGKYTRLESVAPKETVTVNNKTAPGLYDSEGTYVLKIV